MVALFYPQNAFATNNTNDPDIKFNAPFPGNRYLLSETRHNLTGIMNSG
jgi:hypothetical protein